LIEEASKEVVRYPGNASQAQAQQEAPAILNSESFIILATDVPGKDRPIRIVPLRAALYLRALV